MTAQPAQDTGWIQTASGGRFYPLHPEAKHVKIRDIAASLSKVCRFTGHTNRLYTVAEHSFRVSCILEVWGESLDIQMLGLLHDASEAYLSDIARPLKQLPEFQFYRDIEARVEDAIAQAFSLPAGPVQRVKDADMVALAVEAKYLLPDRERAAWDWLPEIPDWLDELGPELGLDDNYTVERTFLRRYNYLESQRV